MTHVPLGYAASLSDILRRAKRHHHGGRHGSSASSLGDALGGAVNQPVSAGAALIAREEAHDIDVLFYGSLNAYRAAILARLRAAGVRVLHANTQRTVFGARLDHLIGRAKVRRRDHCLEHLHRHSRRV